MPIVTHSPIEDSAQGVQLAPLRTLFYDASDGEFPPQVVESVWSTDIRAAWTTAERRVNIRSRPTRRVRWSAYGEGMDVLSLMADAEQAVKSRTMAPLWTSAVTATVQDGATELAGDFRYGAFWPGARMVVYRKGQGQFRFTRPEVIVITDTSIATFTLRLDAPLANFADGDTVEVAPLIECEVVNGAETASRAIDGAQAEWQLSEVAGATCLPGKSVIGTVPEGVEVYEGLPIFDPECRASRDRRTGVASVGGVGRIGEVSVPNVRKGAIPPHTLSQVFECHTRDDNLAYHRFRDSRGGRAYPFWCPMIHERLGRGDGVLHGVAATTIDWLTVPQYVASLAPGRPPVVTRIIEANRIGNSDQLRFAEALPDGMIVRCRRVRYEKDAIEAEWLTPTRVDHAFDVIEVPYEPEIAATVPLRTATPLTFASTIPTGGEGVGSGDNPDGDSYTPPTGGGGGGAFVAACLDAVALGDSFNSSPECFARLMEQEYGVGQGPRIACDAGSFTLPNGKVFEWGDTLYTDTSMGCPDGDPTPASGCVVTVTRTA